MSQQAMGYSALGLGDRPLQALAICFMQVHEIWHLQGYEASVPSSINGGTAVLPP